MTNETPAQPAISYAEIESILTVAMAAPSGDNSQPWNFTWRDGTLEIFYQQSLGSHALNNANHATWLSLGCLLEAIAISASGFKLKAREVFDYTNWQSQPVAILKFYREQVPADPLISEITSRRTHRTLFANDPLPQTLIEQMIAEARSFKSCNFSFRPGPPLKIYDFLKFCDEFLWKNTTVARDFLYWVRMSDQESANHQDGMSWRTLGIQKISLVPLRIIRHFPFLIPWFWHLGFRMVVNQTTRNLLQTNAGTYCLAINDTSANSIKEAGRLGYRLWLLLNSKGFAVQPMSFASLTAFDITLGFAPPQTNERFIARFKAGYSEIKSYFGFSSEQWPVWMFRTGKLLAPELETPSPRVKVQDRMKVYPSDKS